MLAAPELGGGIDHVSDSLSAYFATKTADCDFIDPVYERI
jgi:hypothetical protein